MQQLVNLELVDGEESFSASVVPVTFWTSTDEAMADFKFL
jgi:hypothetical protein